MSSFHLKICVSPLEYLGNSWSRNTIFQIVQSLQFGRRGFIYSVFFSFQKFVQKYLLQQHNSSANLHISVTLRLSTSSVAEKNLKTMTCFFLCIRKDPSSLQFYYCGHFWKCIQIHNILIYTFLLDVNLLGS